ncbi:hypothetical protein BA917_08945 [Helicobacter pullorum]|uniref:hypothetical protein n=1 Tax=Helicobacter pullorum TaxID=35818 RepID=UPI000816A37B|nr:hypothetical protein [Helicobacter pullorum]OCR18248.1 hypothetical protein BA917_08945 [Helicobacter pullorum]
MNYESKFEFIFLMDDKEITKSIPKNTLMDMLNVLVKEAQTKESINQELYDLLVIIQDKAKDYFFRKNSIDGQINIFKRLPKELEKHFKLSKEYQLVAVNSCVSNSSSTISKYLLYSQQEVA